MQKAVGWATLLDRLFDGALLVRPGGEVVSWNPPAAAMLGLSAAAPAGDPARALPPELFDAHRNPLAGGTGPVSDSSSARASCRWLTTPRSWTGRPAPAAG